MKNHIFSIGLLAALAISCSIHEMDFKDTNAFDEFYASIENTETPDTKVYATEDLYLRWNADDRITIFNKYTYNQEYRFTGETGDNSGSFKRVDNGDFVTGNSLENIYAIYPYLESTRISDTGVISVTLPSEQTYAENTMGLGANTMVSATADNQLLFKNVGGYLMLKLYGDDVTVSSISLKGNNGERIAGKATVSMPINGVPTVAMTETAGQEITMVCETPVKIGSTAETATTFWIVVPPTVFSKGFTLTVKDNKNGVFEKATSKSFEISRNKLARMSALEVSLDYPEPSDQAIVFADQKLKERLVAKFDTNGDGELSYKEAAAVTSIEGAITIKTITSFDEFQYFTGVTAIPDDCFSSWAKLNSIVLPKSIKSIGSYAFSDCTSLPSLAIPNGVTSIGANAFQNCSKFSSVSIPNSVTNIGSYAFYQCSSLASVSIPNSITSIESYTFCGCSSLASVVIPNSITSIGADAFFSCSSLASVEIPRSVTTIGNSAFYYCSSLTSVSIPNNVTSIGSDVFRSCPKIESITVDTDNSSYDSRNNCNAIIETKTNCLIVGCKNTIIPEGIQSIGYDAFCECSELYSIIIPESVTSIGNQAFSGCTSLTSVVIPESISIIVNNMFSGCSSLTSIIIPESVTRIENYALNGCTGLLSITVMPTTPPVGTYNMFQNTNNCPIYVPTESVEAYKTASDWNFYSDRIQAIPSPIVPVPEAVDLGLPSGIKWASFNLGASTPEGYGDYYAWGETEPYYSSQDPLTWKEGKEAGYAWNSYKWCMGSGTTLTKYCSDSSFGYNGFTDIKTGLDPEDDAAHANLGGYWRMPTDAELTELQTLCSWELATMNGINGRKVTGPNGNSIFFPISGGFDGLSRKSIDSGLYWSSSLYTNNPLNALNLDFVSGNVFKNSYRRSCGFSIRPVYAE